MEVISTNIARPATIHWKGRSQPTGIFKEPQTEGIFLDTGGVRGDTVGNPKVHGGRLKACYLFSTDDYPYWQGQYPALDWGYGMFGENLSVAGLVESELPMGGTFSLGGARIRITTPREPCFKLGIRFRDQGVIEAFVRHGRPGAYAEVLEPGWVRPGDLLELEDADPAAPDIAAFFAQLFAQEKDVPLLLRALDLGVLPDATSKMLRRWV